MQSVMRDKNGNLMQDKEGAKPRWTEYCTDQCQRNEKRAKTVRELADMAPEEEEEGAENDIRLEEFEAAIGKLKRNN